MINYHKFLPEDFYYPVLAKRAWDKLDRGENVLVGGMYGCGIHTFLNVFSLLEKTKRGVRTDYYAVEDGMGELKLWVKSKMNKPGRKVLAIHGFEKISNRREVLEWLQQQRQPRPAGMVFLVVADHTVVTDPESYLALTSAFFGERLEIGPFDLEHTIRLVKLNAQYFRWEVSEEKFKTIFELTGGVQRLVKHVCRLMSERGVRVEDVEKFTEDPSILFQIDLMVKIMSTCSISNLCKLGITDGTGKIKAGLVAGYWRNYQSEMASQLFPGLSHLESRVFSVLYGNIGRVLSLERMGDVLEIEGSEFSPWAIYKLISRLKPKIERNFRIVTVKGRGYMLERKVQ